MARFTSRDLMVSVLPGNGGAEDWAMAPNTQCTTCTNCTNVTSPTHKPKGKSPLAALQAQLSAARS